MYNEIALFAEKCGATVIKDAPMKKYTSFRCGGNASVLVIPNSVDCLKQIIDFCNSKSIKPLIIGNGSNLLITDNGINGVVIKIGSEACLIGATQNSITFIKKVKLEKVEEKESILDDKSC